MPAASASGRDHDRPRRGGAARRPLRLPLDPARPRHDRARASATSAPSAYRHRTNGKAERFIRTLLGDWAYGATTAPERAHRRPLVPAASAPPVDTDHSAPVEPPPPLTAAGDRLWAVSATAEAAQRGDPVVAAVVEVEGASGTVVGTHTASGGLMLTGLAATDDGVIVADGLHGLLLQID